MKNFTEYRGCLKEINLSVVNKKTIETLLKKGIIHYSKSRPFINSLDKDSLNFNFPIIFDGSVYELNTEFINEIYNTLKNDIENDEANIYHHEKNNSRLSIENIIIIEKHKINAFVKNSSKLKYCNKKYSERLLKIKDVLFYKSYTKHDFDIFHNWEDSTKHEIKSSFIAITKYLKDEIYEDWHYENVKDKNNMFTTKNSWTKKWMKFYKTMRLTEFYYEQIKELNKTEPTQKTKNNIIKLSIREKTLLIQAIRDIKANIWDNLSATTKEKLLNPLINGSERNVRGYIGEIDQKPSEKSEEASRSQEKIDLFLSGLGI